MIFTLDSINRMLQALLIQKSILYDLLLQQRFYLRPLLFYTHYYHLPKLNTFLTLIRKIL